MPDDVRTIDRLSRELSSISPTRRDVGENTVGRVLPTVKRALQARLAPRYPTARYAHVPSR